MNNDNPHFIKINNPEPLTKEGLSDLLNIIANTPSIITTSLPEDNIKEKLLKAINKASPYLSLEQLKDGTWEWTYNCVISEEHEDEPLLTLEDCIVSYIKWSAKELEPINWDYE